MSAHHNTEFTYELADGKKLTFNAGDVIRVLPEGVAFSDAVILGFAEDGECKMSRPYAYANGTGTTCANVLLGAETIVYTVGNMKHIAATAPRTGTRRVT